MKTWTSCKNEFDMSPSKFGELRSSNDLLNTPSKLRQRITEDGYLLLRGLLNKEKVKAARDELLIKMNRNGSVDENYLIREGVDLEMKNKVDQANLRNGVAVRDLT